ncbi:MAG: hypothetical protein LC792_09605, partial [Actinobacteria bacterium]|nr:hypothetical protein [Actinomycetota bacterium]
ANDVVRTYERSPVYKNLHAAAGLKELTAAGIGRRAIDRFKAQVADHGFNHLEALTSDERATRAFDEPARWPAVRTLVLRLLGRQDAPWSEHDKPW